MRKKIESVVFEVLREVLELKPEALRLGCHLRDDLGASSIDVVEVVMRLEEAFDVALPDEAADQVQSVADVVDYLVKLMGSKDESQDATVEKGAPDLVIASDHAGFELKEALVSHLRAREIEFQDLGPGSGQSCDYPDQAALVARRVGGGEVRRGVLICGTGIGISIAANKVEGVRAALVRSAYEATMSRRHNDANILCLGARVVGVGQACAALDAFLDADFDPGDDGRHRRRVEKIHVLRERQEK